jgi:hypothetical protein
VGYSTTSNFVICAHFLVDPIVRVVTSRRIRWTGHVPRMGKQGVLTEFLWVNFCKTLTWQTDNEVGVT